MRAMDIAIQNSEPLWDTENDLKVKEEIISLKCFNVRFPSYALHLDKVHELDCCHQSHSVHCSYFIILGLILLKCDIAFIINMINFKETNYL